MPDAEAIAARSAELAQHAVEQLVAFIEDAPRDALEDALRRVAEDPFIGLDLLLEATRVIAPDEELDTVSRLHQDGLDALERGDVAAVEGSADELLAMIDDPEQAWQRGWLVHEGHRLRGLARLRRGDVDGAASELRAAGESEGSPVLDSFGPDLTLAWDLLQLDRDADVIAYLHGVARFWSPTP